MAVGKSQSWHKIGDFWCPPTTFTTSTPPNRGRALFRVRKAMAEVVYDTVALEGNPMTFPEVQTLIDGVTVGGHRVSDAEQVLNQAASWSHLLDLVSQGRFKPDAETACELHGLVAREEAMGWGVFRTGAVSISGTEYRPPDAQSLPVQFEACRRRIGRIPCSFTRAMATYLMTARGQFFWDGNKRTGRLLMNGMLLSEGYDAICVPAKRRLEFNEKMIAFYDTADAEPMLMFLASCSLDKNLERDGHTCERAQKRQESPAKPSGPPMSKT